MIRSWRSMPSCSTRSPSDKQGWDTIVTDLPCVHARNIEQDVQHNMDAIVISRAQAERVEFGLMQRVSMIRLEYNDWAELFRLWRTPTLSRPNVESLRRKFWKCKTRSAKFLADEEASKRKAPWLRSLCWNRDASRDAALLASSEEDAQTFFVLFAHQTNQTAMFSPLRRFQLALLALTHVSGKEALDASGEPP